VHHVVLLLPGQNLQIQNHQQIYFNSWNQFIQLKNRGQTISVLTKAVWCFVQVSVMAAGKHGRGLADSLLIHITTTLIVFQMFYAENTVTLLPKMGLHPIWL
jgi:hypothetical protein